MRSPRHPMRWHVCSVVAGIAIGWLTDFSTKPSTTTNASDKITPPAFRPSNVKPNRFKEWNSLRPTTSLLTADNEGIIAQIAALSTTTPADKFRKLHSQLGLLRATDLAALSTHIEQFGKIWSLAHPQEAVAALVPAFSRRTTNLQADGYRSGLLAAIQEAPNLVASALKDLPASSAKDSVLVSGFLQILSAKDLTQASAFLQNDNSTIASLTTTGIKLEDFLSLGKALQESDPFQTLANPHPLPEPLLQEFAGYVRIHNPNLLAECSLQQQANGNNTLATDFFRKSFGSGGAAREMLLAADPSMLNELVRSSALKLADADSTHKDFLLSASKAVLDLVPSETTDLVNRMALMTNASEYLRSLDPSTAIATLKKHDPAMASSRYDTYAATLVLKEDASGTNRAHAAATLLSSGGSLDSLYQYTGTTDINSLTKALGLSNSDNLKAMWTQEPQRAAYLLSALGEMGNTIAANAAIPSTELDQYRIAYGLQNGTVTASDFFTSMASIPPNTANNDAANHALDIAISQTLANGTSLPELATQLSNITGELTSDGPARSLFSSWAEVSPETYSEFLATTSPNWPARDAAVALLINNLSSDPERALGWANTLSDPQARAAAIATITARNN